MYLRRSTQIGKFPVADGALEYCGKILRQFVVNISMLQADVKALAKQLEGTT